MQRRDFLELSARGVLIACSASLITQELYAEDGQLYKTYNKVLLVDEQDNPIHLASLEKEKPYIFNYPFVATPVMLLNLEEPTAKETPLKSADNKEYLWKGGVGENNSLVAFSAICSHQLTHPNPNDSFITYCNQSMGCDQKGKIVCVSHLSSFDPKQGAINHSGPAEEPLASILLEIDENDQIWAVGILGPDKFHAFFKSFKDEFKEFYGGKRKAKKQIISSATVLPLESYSTEVISL